MWAKASDDVIETAQGLIEQYHPWLKEARIGFLFREEAPVSNGRITFGKAKKVSDQDKTLLDLDFIIWLAEDEFSRMTGSQRRALIDHELCHCYMDNDGKITMRKHDVEEFHCILERHGFWWPGSTTTAEAAQKAFDFITGSVVSIDMTKRVNGKDVLDQLGDMFGE
jgi:hypothetical protein